MFLLIGVVIGWLLRSSTLDRTAYTLYRNSATGITERIHIATFNASEADSYNNENCQQAQTVRRRRRRLMSKSQRAAVSKRMRAYWAERRKGGKA
jgi:hypothetical protein